MNPISFKGKEVLKWLGKWPDLPSMTLAKMIYNADDNYKLFKSIEDVRTFIRYYKGKNGDLNRKRITIRKFIKP